MCIMLSIKIRPKHAYVALRDKTYNLKMKSITRMIESIHIDMIKLEERLVPLDKDFDLLCDIDPKTDTLVCK